MTSTWISKQRVSGRFIIVFVILIGFGSFVAAYVAISLSRPAGSPLAQMYRTEADMRSIQTAVETYQRDLGVYPPAGDTGMRLATDHLSRIADYLPNGPPFDAWERTYHYVPSSAYATPGSEALRGDHGYFAPDSYQLYSAGADGATGVNDPSKQRDNITSWDGSKTWRAWYSSLHRQYLTEHLDKPAKTPGK